MKNVKEEPVNGINPTTRNVKTVRKIYWEKHVKQMESIIGIENKQWERVKIL